MGISLNGLTPAGTYPGLIKTGDNTAISGTPKVLSDGNGNNLPMEVSTTEVNFTNQLKQGGVAVPTASQVAAKQDTLVSGTNIKTINGASVLGSGNIVTPSTNPSGVSGAIQFSNGSAFASDAANLFWDNTNKRLGVGTNAPSVPLEVLGNAWINAPASTDAILSIGNPSRRWDVKALQSGAYYQVVYNNGLIGQSIDYLGNVAFGNVAALSARLGIKGSGSTSATTSLLVQNSAGTQLLKVTDDNVLTTGNINIGTSGGESIRDFSGLQAFSFFYNNTQVRNQLSFSGGYLGAFIPVGGTTSSFPALKRSTTNLQVRLADDSGYAPIDASLYKVGGTNGFTGTGSYTNFTIVGGIITNAS